MDDGINRSELTPEELAEARRYPVSIEWSAEDDVFVVSVPDLPGVHTHGATREEAAAMGDEVIAVFLTAMRDAGLQVPSPSKSNHLIVKSPPTYDASRIREIRRGLEVSQRVFADMLNVSLAAVRSWEQGVRSPDGAAMRLLSIAERHPEIILEAVSISATSPDRRSTRAGRAA